METEDRERVKKIFVIDTSVIIYDHASVKSFDEHDVVIPITVLEELENFKKGNDVKNFQAREFIRMLDKITVNVAPEDIGSWMSFLTKKEGRIKITLDNKLSSKTNAAQVYDKESNDNRIINAALQEREDNPNRMIVLVSKDINLRLKARALGLHSEDYETGKVINTDNFPTGIVEIDDCDIGIISRLFEQKEINGDNIQDERCRVSNSYYILKNKSRSALGYFNTKKQQMKLIEKYPAYGIKPRNAEQAFAMHAVLNSDIELVALHGVAGTGKTLIALAAALEQSKLYKQIYLARPIVPLSNKDIGYLPGDVKSKIDPYMQPLWDNLKFIQYQFDKTDKLYRRIDGMLENEKLMITPLAYIRGRSLSEVLFIVDEAQNLTPHEVKTIVTRAGHGAKFIFTGDINQIDTPYLDEHSNGLSYLINKFSGQKVFAHIQLTKGERSSLADLANKLL